MGELDLLIPLQDDNDSIRPLDISLPTHVEKDVPELFDAAVEYGFSPLYLLY